MVCGGGGGGGGGVLVCLVSWWGGRLRVSLFVLLVVVVGLFIVLYEFSRLVSVVRRFKNKITGCGRFGLGAGGWLIRVGKRGGRFDNRLVIVGTLDGG